MGFFDFLKSEKQTDQPEQNPVPWQLLSRMEQLKEIEQLSKTKPVAIFKHSTRCGISRMVLRQFEKSYGIETDKMHLFFLDLLANRAISDEIAIRFQVLHQSPQLIIVKNGVAVAHASHHGIRAHELEHFV